MQFFKVWLKHLQEYARVISVLTKEIIKISLNNLLLHLLFYLYKLSIFLVLANLSVSLSLKLTIFSIINFPHNMAKAE